MEPREILMRVHNALKEKGYNPINQIVGYILSGDPSYITSHQSARSLIRRLERDEILEELVTFYVEHASSEFSDNHWLIDLKTDTLSLCIGFLCFCYNIVI